MAFTLLCALFGTVIRHPTCIEVDFPIIPINEIEGNAGKPIYQMSKWWARRRSSVFRAMLLASAIKAPDDPSEAAKLVWDVYYGNHQKKGAFKPLKVADIFMGGGTTIVEGSRLGMQMFGNDLNPVAWFIVKNELARVDKAEVEAVLADIEAEVKPQIMPFYACDCPRGHKGEWMLMGLDHPTLGRLSERWRSAPPSGIGAVAKSDLEQPIALSVWGVQSFGGGSGAGACIIPIAVDLEGKRVPAIEKRYRDVFRTPAAHPVFQPSERADLMHRHVEPTLQRELSYRGIARPEKGYASELVAWVEVR